MQSIFEIADIRPLTPENSEILLEGDFPVLYLLEDGQKKRVGIVEVKQAFPFEKSDEFIVLSDEEGKDQGFIRSLAERNESEHKILEKELARRYFMPVIKKILKVTDRFGFSYWKVETDGGILEFSVRDAYKSIIRPDERMIITDADGNRFVIPNVNTLDKKSRRKIELYLW